MSDDPRDNDSSLGDALLGGVVVLVVLAFLLLAALSVFLFGPGMALVGLVHLWGVALDTTQLWTFAIGVAMKVLQIYDGTPAAADMKVIFERLAQLMPAEMRVLPSSLMERLYVQPMPLRLVAPAVWESVATSLRDRTTLEISYRKPNVQEATREIEPYGLVLTASNWIVVARDPADGLIKNFYVSRITRARVQATRYAVPKDFSAERHFGESLGIFTGKDSFRFRVRFGKDSAAWISEVSWHPRQKRTRLQSGEIELELPTSSMWEARRFVLSFGKLARAMSPKELVEDVRRELREAAAVYEE